MSTPEKLLWDEELPLKNGQVDYEALALKRAEFLRGIQIPEPEEIYFKLPGGDPAKAIALLESWRNEEDDGEQKETMEYLMRVLDEDRLSYRKLFP